MSPRKIRLVTDLIKKMKPTDAVAQLPFVQKRAADFVSKVIKNAMASAKVQGISETDLIFKEIQVGEGPTLKRGRAASRGRWAPIKKKMAHIRVVLTTRKSQAPSTKLQTNEKIQKETKKGGVKSDSK